MSWWFNIRSGCVQSDHERGQDVDVLGPYETREEAERALETARAKTEAWDAEDREWDNRGAEPGWSAD
ncbi:MAG: methionine aminopeptidase [Actinomycetales bacterium]|nr:MAG: methionine aminopeptidase [Actinomycetales bacterium]